MTDVIIHSWRIPGNVMDVQSGRRYVGATHFTNIYLRCKS